MPLTEEKNLLSLIATDTGLKSFQVANTVELLSEKATVPFIARYRKEKTGDLDENDIRNIASRYEYYKALEKRKEFVLSQINKTGSLDEETKKIIENCFDASFLEQIYQPYKLGKKTRAAIAKEKGLLPLAEIMLLPVVKETKSDVAKKFINPEKGVKTVEDALKGASDIIAEKISTDINIRTFINNLIQADGFITSKVKKKYENVRSKYEPYYKFTNPIKKLKSHSCLAIRRAADEGFVSWSIDIDDERAIEYIERKYLRKNVFQKELEEAIEDSYKRLIFPSASNGVFSKEIEKAEKEALRLFAENLKSLLLAEPLGAKPVVGVDPGFRTGCKAAVVDEKGDYKDSLIFYPEKNDKTNLNTLVGLLQKYGVKHIAIGNGTGSREALGSISKTLEDAKLHKEVSASLVSEAGASVYSASECAQKEFKNLDITIRSAISIARRVQDPLAELVKIDPKSIGVGQYQHDINQSFLKQELDNVVESCVNAVGADINTASAELLAYISGIGKTIADRIVKYRSENGVFKNRKEILKVEKIGSFTFQQCAGFLTIQNGESPLDATFIHPESYSVVETISQKSGLSIKEIVENPLRIDKRNIMDYTSKDIGELTVKEIIKELERKGRDPRKDFNYAQFSPDVLEIDDLKEGMVLEGKVTNVAGFGAFVDIGVHKDGLIHISKLSKNFVKDPCDVVKPGEKVTVKVISIDKEVGRISLERVLD